LLKPLKPTRLDSEDRIVEKTLPLPKLVDPLQHSYFPNVTGFIRGPSSVFNLTAETSRLEHMSWDHDAVAFMEGVNRTELVEKLGTWNWTSVQRVAISALEKQREIDDDLKTLVNGTEHILPVQVCDSVYTMMYAELMYKGSYRTRRREY
jgi:hypothetical protein